MAKEIYLAGGCFWGCQKYFDRIPGVTQTQVGYANGPFPSPTYEQVCRHAGHAETVRVVYDERTLPLETLLSRYLEVIDPTSVNQQGPDRGVQYRAGIYYTDPADAPVARRLLDELAARLERPLAVELLPLQNYSPAEAYHQKYLQKNPDGYCHIRFD